MRIVVLTLLAVFTTACAASAPVEVTREVTRVVELTAVPPTPVEIPVEVTRIVEVVVTSVVEVTREVPVEVTVVATSTMPAATAVIDELSGEGSVVTDNYDWPACDKAVFVWDAEGSRNVIARLHKPDSDRDVLIVNGIAPDSGETLQPLAGGTYYVEVDATSASWRITVECRD